jgi:hypothetical protein
MGQPARELDRVYTYADNKTWPDDEWWELIEGVAWNMSPTPNLHHQSISYTSKKDLSDKLALYEKHRVVEYWVVDPDNHYIQVAQGRTAATRTRSCWSRARPWNPRSAPGSRSGWTRCSPRPEPRRGSRSPRTPRERGPQGCACGAPVRAPKWSPSRSSATSICARSIPE